MKIKRIQVKKGKDKEKEKIDRKQYSRLFSRSYKGGLNSQIITKYKELYGE